MTGRISLNIEMYLSVVITRDMSQLSMMNLILSIGVTGSMGMYVNPESMREYTELNNLTSLSMHSPIFMPVFFGPSSFRIALLRIEACSINC